MKYIAQAILDDGAMMVTTGTITECTEWADRILREHPGEIYIRIWRDD